MKRCAIILLGLAAWAGFAPNSFSGFSIAIKEPEVPLYPVFAPFPMYEDGVQYTDIELKASEVNFSPTSLSYDTLGALHRMIDWDLDHYLAVDADSGYMDDDCESFVYHSDNRWIFDLRLPRTRPNGEFFWRRKKFSVGDGGDALFPPEGTKGLKYHGAYCYWYVSKRDLNDVDWPVTISDKNAHLYYLKSGSIRESRSRRLYPGSSKSLAEHLDPSVESCSFVSIYPSRVLYGRQTVSWMHPNNKKLKWVYRRYLPFGGKEVDGNGKDVWHPCEPIAWLPYQK